MARSHYQIAIRDYNERYIRSKKFYFEDREKEFKNVCKTKYIEENETEE